jgi:hypothetical protein
MWRIKQMLEPIVVKNWSCFGDEIEKVMC